MSEDILCDYCQKYIARTKDYRDVDGCVGKHLACRWCANLNNVAVYQIRTEGIDPVSMYESIDLDKLPIEELQELNDIQYSDVLERMGIEMHLVDKLIEYERALTKREEVK